MADNGSEGQAPAHTANESLQQMTVGVPATTASKAACPYCLWPIAATEVVAQCRHCGVRLHVECYHEAGRCTTFGCAAWSNPDEFGPVPDVAPTVSTVPPPPPHSGPVPAAAGFALPPVSPPASPSFTVTFDDRPAAGQPPQARPPAVFCSNCGSERQSGRAFCTKCGWRFPA